MGSLKRTTERDDVVMWHCLHQHSESLKCFTQGRLILGVQCQIYAYLVAEKETNRQQIRPLLGLLNHAM